MSTANVAEPHLRFHDRLALTAPAVIACTKPVGLAGLGQAEDTLLVDLSTGVGFRQNGEPNPRAHLSFERLG